MAELINDERLLQVQEEEVMEPVRVEEEVEKDEVPVIVSSASSAVVDEAPSEVVQVQEQAQEQAQTQKQQLVSHLGLWTTPSSASSTATDAATTTSWWRYGMLAYVLGTLALLLASDIGSGIQVITATVPAPDDIWSKTTETLVADESIFSSVRQLWNTGSYVLAIFIGITSIVWPYVKLLLTIFAWVAPFTVEKGGRRREQLIGVLDVLGKWSFADVLVFCQLLVAFRATVPVGFGTTLEVYLLALWGFYGFVAATFLGLIGTHVILYYHRQCIYSLPAADDSQYDDTTMQQETPSQTELVTPTNQLTPTPTPKQHGHWTGMGTTQRCGIAAVLVAAMTVYIVGCSLPIFEISRQRGDVETTYVEFSIISMGSQYVDLTKDSSIGDRWVQFLWFFLTIVMPVVSTLFLCCVLLVPLGYRRRQEQLYFAAETAFCWSCAEVTVVSTIFAVMEIPHVGGGMVDSGCNVCYVIGSTLFPSAFAPLAVGALLHVLTSLWLFRGMHRTLYPHVRGRMIETKKEDTQLSLTNATPSNDVEC